MSFKRFVCGPLENNVYLLICNTTNKALIIDPAQHSSKKVLPYLHENHLTLEKILLTHAHWDHIFDVKTLHDQTHAKVAVHTLDAPELENPSSDGIFGFPKVPSAKAELLLEDTQEITLGMMTIKVLHTPGHTPGGVCFYIEKEHLLFTGDTLFCGTCGALHFPGGNADDMHKSLKKLIQLPPETVVLPGHGKSTTIGEENWI